MKEQEQHLKQLYLNYIDAFSKLDIEATRQCYQLPCVLSTPEKVIVLDSEQSFEREFRDIFAMLADNHIAGFKASNMSFQSIDDNTYMAKIDWQFLTKDNAVFTEFSAIYHLSYQQNQFKIFNVISHDMCQINHLSHLFSLSSGEQN